MDTAQLLLVTDIKYADLELYVTRFNFTDKKLIEFPNNSLESEKLNNVGFIK